MRLCEEMGNRPTKNLFHYGDGPDKGMDGNFNLRGRLFLDKIMTSAECYWCLFIGLFEDL